MRLNLDLTTQLVLDACLTQLALVQDFERDDEVGFLLAREVDLGELAVAEGLTDIKITQ